MILRWIIHLLLMSRWLLLLLAVGAVGYIIVARVLRVGGSGAKKHGCAGLAASGSAASQASEAVMLGCVLTVFVVFWTHVRHAWGKPDLHLVIWHPYVLAGLLGLCAWTVWVALRSSTRGLWVALGTGLLALSYGIQGIRPSLPDQTLAMETTVCQFVVRDHPGAKVWVNDVYLGESPVEISLDAFLQQVPYWSEPPAGLANRVEKRHLQYQTYKSWSSQRYSEWMDFDLADVPSRRYYLRTQYDGAIGFGSRSGHSGHSANGRMVHTYHFHAFYPLREHKLELMLDQARLADYQVDEMWLRIMDAYGQAAWQALYEAAYRDWLGPGKMHYPWLSPKPSEPGLLQVMDDWAVWRYDLAKVSNENEAWQVFQKLCRSVDAVRRYASQGLEGHALGLLLPKLNQQQLVASAVQLIQASRFQKMALQSYYDWIKGCFDSRDPGVNRQHLVLPSDYLLVDAIARLDTLLDEQDDTTANLVEQQVSNAILFWQGPELYPALRLAVVFGGTDLASFLRKQWQASQSQSGHARNSFSCSSLPNDVNLWLLLLAHLEGEAGQRFRLTHANHMGRLIEQLATHNRHHTFAWGHLNFITLDVELGQECIGAQFWPNYFNLIKSSAEDYENNKLSRLWNYLIRLEPVMPAEVYVQCWRESDNRYGHFRDALSTLEILPAAKHRVVLEGLQAELTLRPGNIKDRSSMSSQEEVAYLQKQLDFLLVQTDPELFARQIMDDLRGQRKTEHILDWLARKRPAHSVAQHLAQSSNASFRRMAVQLLAQHPTPPRFQQLTALLEDLEPTVHAAARQAMDKLNHLGKHPEELMPQPASRPAQFPLDPPLLMARLYPEAQPAGQFTTVRLPVDLAWEVGDLDANGQLSYRLVDINMDNPDSKRLPDDGYLVICAADQTFACIATFLDANLFAWQLPSRNFTFDRGAYSAEHQICDAAGHPVVGAQLTLELKGHQADNILRIVGFESDARGKAQVTSVRGGFYLYGLLFRHPQYGMARLGRSALREAQWVVPLVGPETPESDRALFGSVIDSHGKPVGGAQVQVTAGPVSHPLHSGMWAATIYTDAQGRFSIYPCGRNLSVQLAPLGRYRLVVTSPDRRDLPLYTGWHENGRELTIELSAPSL